MNRSVHSFSSLALTVGLLVLASTRLPADTGTCGGAITTLPFTDVAGSTFFCQIAAAYFSGLTNGTTTTTYSPSDPVLRDQMAAFLTRTQDSALRRGSRKAAIGQWGFPDALPQTGRTTVGNAPSDVKSDGADLWVANLGSDDVMRVRASDGAVLGTWTNAESAVAVLVSRGLVYAAGLTSPGRLYFLNPVNVPTPISTLSSTLGNQPSAIATDGHFIWTANANSISKVDPNGGTTITLTAGFGGPTGIVFDGSNLWVTDLPSNLKKLDATGSVTQTVSVGLGPSRPVFDGSNIWVPNKVDNSISVVRVRDGVVAATLTGNGLNRPVQAAFDGQFMCVTNQGGASPISIWKAVDLTPAGSFPTAATAGSPNALCSDGINFWITLFADNKLARF